MSIFSSIGNAIQRANQKAELKAKPYTEQIEAMDLTNGAILLCKEFGRLSLTVHAKVLQTYWRKVERYEKGQRYDDIYQAFCTTYQMSTRPSGSAAVSIAQRLGRILYDAGDGRVREKELDESHVRYIPEGYF